MNPFPLIFEGHKANITDLSWSNNSKKILTCSIDKRIILWDF